jgi:hypothetical protein
LADHEKITHAAGRLIGASDTAAAVAICSWQSHQRVVQPRRNIRKRAQPMLSPSLDRKMCDTKAH